MTTDYGLKIERLLSKVPTRSILLILLLLCLGFSPTCEPLRSSLDHKIKHEITLALGVTVVDTCRRLIFLRGIYSIGHDIVQLFTSRQQLLLVSSSPGSPPGSGGEAWK